MRTIQILIAGMPATGKSCFGKWLADTKGFIHVDMELSDNEPNSLGSNNLREEWNLFCDGSDRDRLLRAVKGGTSSVVLNWGFPPNRTTLSCVSALKAGGVSLWWFEGDYGAARKVFEQRARQRLFLGSLRSKRIANELNLFDSQYDALSKAWAGIEPLFRDHVITTLRADGSFLEKEEILSRIMEL